MKERIKQRRNDRAHDAYVRSLECSHLPDLVELTKATRDEQADDPPPSGIKGRLPTSRR